MFGVPNLDLPSGYVTYSSHGKFLINGGFLAGKIIYFYGPFSMAMLNNQRVHPYGGFHEWGYPTSWMVEFMESPIFSGDDLD